MLASAALLLLQTTNPAFAKKDHDRDRMEISAAARGLNIGDQNVMVGAEPGLVHTEFGDSILLAVPLRYGVNNDIEIFASPQIENLNSSPTLHEPAIGGQYRFTKGKYQVGARVFADLSLLGASKSAALGFGVPVRAHLAKGLAGDAAVLALVGLSEGSAFGASIPVTVTYNASKTTFIQAITGLTIYDLADTSALGVPASGAVGYTLAKKKKPWLDVGAKAGFGDVQVTEILTGGVFARFYFYP